MPDPDSGVRYWGAMGVLMRGESELKAAHEPVVKALVDSSPSVRIVAAEILGKYGTKDELARSLEVLITLANPVTNGLYLAAQSLNVIDVLGDKAAPLKAQVAALPKPSATESNRVTPIIESLCKSIAGNS